MRMIMHSQDLALRLRVARKAALAAGHVIMANYGETLHVQTKSSTVDLVTHVDLECDALIREILTEACPEDTVITEETYADGGFDLAQAWLVDPVDGTTNYAHGFPHFAVSIAYVEQGEPKAAVIYDPFKNELFTATTDEPAMKNGVPIQTSCVDLLEQALLATGFPYSVHTDSAQDNNLSLHERFIRKTHGIRRAGAAALDLAYVACGRLDGFWELRLAPWDVAAGCLLIRQAGGTVTDFQGHPLDLAQRMIDIVGANTRLHPQLIAVTTEPS